MVQAALSYLNMSVVEWLNLFNDYPSLTTKAHVAHKEILKTNYEENKVIEPQGIIENICILDVQPMID
jgi:hypothetical protein